MFPFRPRAAFRRSRAAVWTQLSRRPPPSCAGWPTTGPARSPTPARRWTSPWTGCAGGRAWRDRPRPRGATRPKLVRRPPLPRLRDFSAPSPADVVPTLVLPPQAGHDSCIVDFSPQQSQMRTVRAVGLDRLYSMDWIGATQATKAATISDYLAEIAACIDEIGDGPVNLVGDCQGGWLATIYAALHPEQVNTLTIAGAPIDFHAGDAV